MRDTSTSLKTMHPVRFHTNRIPWQLPIEKTLINDGYDTIELLKVMNKEEGNESFDGKEVAQQRLSGIVFWYLQQEPAKSSKCATNIHLSPATNPPPVATNGSIKQSCRHTENNLASHLLVKYLY